MNHFERERRALQREFDSLSCAMTLAQYAQRLNEIDSREREDQLARSAEQFATALRNYRAAPGPSLSVHGDAADLCKKLIAKFARARGDAEYV